MISKYFFPLWFCIHYRSIDSWIKSLPNNLYVTVIFKNVRIFFVKSNYFTMLEFLLPPLLLFFFCYVFHSYSDVWLFLVVVQRYETDVGKEYVIRGNDALMKCSIPSFVSDVVQIIAWLDSEQQTVYLNQKR